MIKIQDILPKKRKFTTYLIFALLSILFATAFSNTPFGYRYEQNEYCVVQAIEREQQWFRDNNSDFFELSKKNGKVFVKSDGQFIPYDPTLHQFQIDIFIELDGHNIKASNAKSFALNDPCTLTKKFYIIYAFLLLACFIFLCFVVPVGQNFNSNQKNSKLREVVITIFILFISSRMADLAIYAPLSHNPQGQYCKMQANTYTKERRLEDLYSFLRQKAFVEIDGKFVPYNRSLHEDYEFSFVECDGCNIHLSNSKSVSGGDPCMLTKDFYKFYAFLFAIFFLFFNLSYFFTYKLIKPKNPKNKGE